MPSPAAILASATSSIWGGDEADRLSLCATFLMAVCVSVGMLAIWSIVLAPAVPGYLQRSDTDKVFLGNSFVSSWPAFTAPVLAGMALWQLKWDDLDSFMTSAPSEYALRAVGLSCGYMAYDTMYCLYYSEMRSPLIIGHHTLPVLYFPYCALVRGRRRSLFLYIHARTHAHAHTRLDSCAHIPLSCLSLPSPPPLRTGARCPSSSSSSSPS